MTSSSTQRPQPLKAEHWALSVARAGGADEPTRWRIAISRKVLSLATQRNRWKRRIREVLRRYKNRTLSGYEGTFSLRQAGDEPPFALLEAEVLELLKRSGLLAEEEL